MNLGKSIIIGFLFSAIVLISGCTQIIQKCSLDSDCVPAQCCHPTDCISKNLAPDCSNVACTKNCELGTMDCGQGKCVCENSECRVEWDLPSEQYCESDSDCVCGVHKETGECFIGNRKYAKSDVNCQWPDFCTGITGDLIIKCENNECVQVSRDENSKYECSSDSDCVHLPSPCHQGSQKCVSKDYASKIKLPDEPVACTMECRACTECYCEDNVCRTRTLEPEGCC